MKAGRTGGRGLAGPGLEACLGGGEAGLAQLSLWLTTHKRMAFSSGSGLHLNPGRGMEKQGFHTFSWLQINYRDANFCTLKNFALEAMALKAPPMLRLCL